MIKEAFYLENHPHVALNDLLKMTGIAETGGRAKLMVADELISVNGALELRKTAKILAGSVVTGTIDGQDFEITVLEGFPA
ncbi:RNA-binding S4 domain-containing protein [Ignatzschineria rhizosphaerae]|uniref:RNA-binding S4 domain-containing protein n=1 Tax=Ignatzschineria rhizosphaerae TaxID=2923279 RepID=UPI0022CF1A12|nr:RNA-binding S4 domain-containing protein [Ignatzschineria rhizosphaerae]